MFYFSYYNLFDLFENTEYRQIQSNSALVLASWLGIQAWGKIMWTVNSNSRLHAVFQIHDIILVVSCIFLRIWKFKRVHTQQKNQGNADFKYYNWMPILVTSKYIIKIVMSRYRQIFI